MVNPPPLSSFPKRRSASQTGINKLFQSVNNIDEPAPRSGGVFVAGARQCGGAGESWGVLVMVRDGDGVFAQACVTPAAARALAGELGQMADIIEGARW